MNRRAVFSTRTAFIAVISTMLFSGCDQRRPPDSADDDASDSAASTAPAASWKPPLCDDPDPRKCAARDLAEAERKMESEYRAAIDRIQNCEPSNSTRCHNLPRALDLIEAEQHAWLAWRNAHCDVVAFGMQETSAEGQVRADCRTPLTIKRTHELSEIRKA